MDERDTADEEGISPLIRYRHRVVSADWSAADARWTLYEQIAGVHRTVTEHGDAPAATPSTATEEGKQ